MSARSITPTLNQPDEADKQKIVAAARAAHAIPEEQEFWKEVSERLDKYDADAESKVSPRPKK